MQCLVQLLSVKLAIGPDDSHLCFSIGSIMSVIFVLFPVCEHGISPCSFILSCPLFFDQFLVSLSVVY